MNDQPENSGDAEREVFLEALDYESPQQRAVFLDRACANKPAVRAAVESLLKHHKQDEFMRAPGLKSALLSGLEKPGDRIGRYKLLQQIGEGGCGVVYMAEQEEPVRRLLALKVIKLGMDTRSVIARFEAERQALALMDHANIAKVLDAGATETGRPYFVMELVRGIKITDYCDQNNLSTKERLQLFIQVCQAIQHAHQKGVIHRDIKPANILVTLRDGVPVPKVIDFGIAKATTEQRLTDKTLFTAFQQFIGTPAYMSPEQAEMSELGVDTRSDIYSLGVLLYELLTGQTPFDSKVLLQSGLDEIRRVIRQQEPVRPSTRLSTMVEGDLTVTAQKRRSEPAKLSALIRGDLDWIVMKALEKDRTRRYDTAIGLAADVQRHLSNEPVVASPPSNLYRFEKLARRNKLAFFAASAVTAALIVALGIAVAAVVRIKRDNQQIRQAKDDATEKLRRAYLAEARATRMSGQAGQRFVSLEAVKNAAAIQSDLAVRNEAIASLAVSDLRVAKQTIITGHAHNEYAHFDMAFERYAYGETNGNITIRAASNNLMEEVLSAPGYTLEGVGAFSVNGKYLSAGYWRGGEGESYWIWDVKNQAVVIRAFHQADDTNAVSFPFAADFSPDSRFFVSSRRDGNISVYDLVLGKEIKRLPGTRLFNRLILNPSDTRLACSSRESPQAEVRDAVSGQTLLTMNCPAGVTAINWSSDGKRLANGCLDNSIYVWDAETGQRLAVLEGHTSFITSVEFSHAGNLLASADYEGIRLWNVATGRQLASHRGTSWQMPFSPNDQRLLGWQDGSRYGSLEVCLSRECRQLYVPREGGFCSVPAFSAEGRILATATESKVRFWDAHSGQEIGSFRLKDSDDFVFNPDGRSLITVDRTAGIRQRNLEQLGGPASSAYRLGKPRRFFDALDMEGASLSLDGRHLAVTERLEGQAFIFDLQNPSAKVVLAGHPLVNRIALSPDGCWAATASWNNPLVKVWDARTGDLQRTFSLTDRAWVAFSPDSRWLAASYSQYQLWEVGSWQPKGPPKNGFDGPANNFTAFSPDGQMMARSEVHKIQLFETLTEKPLATLEAPGSISMERFQFSPDGTQLAVMRQDQQVQFWDLRLIRQELAQMHLDWDLPPYPPVNKAAPTDPVTLEIEPDSDVPHPAQAETNR